MNADEHYEIILRSSDPHLDLSDEPRAFDPRSELERITYYAGPRGFCVHVGGICVADVMERVFAETLVTALRIVQTAISAETGDSLERILLAHVGAVPSLTGELALRTTLAEIQVSCTPRSAYGT